MEPLLAIAIGILFAAAIYMMLRRSIVKLVIGLMLLSNAANLLIFVSAGLTRGGPPLVPQGMTAPEGVVADPLPQALVRHRHCLRCAVVRRRAGAPRLGDCSRR